MTQAEYVAQHGAAAGEQAGSPEFRALLETAREENPFIVKTASDPTTLINLAGAATGWAECLRWLKSAHVLPKKPEPHSLKRTYENPADNQHSPTTENKKP